MQRDNFEAGRGGSPNRPRRARIHQRRAIEVNRPYLKSAAAFALYEVLIGLAIFVIGVFALGHAVENCLNASTISAEDERIRQVLSNRMAEIQATPGIPDASKEIKIDTGYGIVQLVQKTAPADLKQNDGTQLDKINVVTLTAKWIRGGVEQSRQIEFYVYRVG